jgi:hypothetical protein
MKTNRELRKFGITMAVALLVFGLFFLWRDKAAWSPLLQLSGVFLVVALIIPKALAPIEWAWMKLAFVLGTVVTYILLSLTFFLIITPLGLVMRIFGKDSLALKPDPNRKSFWIEVKADGPASRPDKPY